ncbi:hypothetical protein DHEL01_v202376 [Diaporthe helianthi]|uniref:Uncharacterized protein n=1 Tax=Diaporthe helianthi TaxID=158607 RepID=A0A2P5I9P6_DIAHE|nr:hypothetical protein DHEL01_v202376 [Diaporthe helianthi]
MADRKPDNIPSNLVKVGTLTEPHNVTDATDATTATPTTMPSFTGNQPNPSSSTSDPPPPLPKSLDQPTPAEDLALDNWIKRNTSYLATIPWYKYAQMPVLSWLWGYSDADFHHECVSTYIFYTRAIGRKLTDEERDGVLEPVARSAVAASYDRPIAMGLGSWLMARSWAKSGAREAVRKAAEEAAAAAAATAMGTGLGTGTVGADGHITHFSTPQQHTGIAGRFGFGGGNFSSSNNSNRGRVIGQLFKRAGRASVPGLLCFVGLQVLSEPYRMYLSDNETWTMHSDARLIALADDMEKNLTTRAGDIEDLLRRRGF